MSIGSDRVRRALGLGVLTMWVAVAQTPNRAVAVNPPIEQPDAQRTKEQFSQLLDRYPPSLRSIFALDPALLSNPAYLATYPALAAYLSGHPEIARNPAYYVPGNFNFNRPFAQDHSSQVLDMERSVLAALAAFGAFGMALGMAVWLIRTILDYRRWNRLNRVQTEAHTKLLDRFTGSDELMAYVQSPAGARFLESSPIALDAGPRSVGAPLGRILWSVQAGMVLVALGIGLALIGGNSQDDVAQSLRNAGILGVAVGIGFVASAIVSFLISRRLGLIETPLSRP